MYKKVNFIALILLFASITIVGCNKKTDSESTQTENVNNTSSSYLAMVKDENDKYGYINEKGEEVIPCQYDMSVEFSENGLAHIIAPNENGYIDKTGKEVIPLKYVSSCAASDGDLIALAQGDSKKNDFLAYDWAIFNSQGTQLTDFKYQYELPPNSWKNKDNVFVVAQKSDAQDEDGNVIFNCGVINSEGEEVIPISEQIIDYYNEPIGNSGLIGVGRKQDDGSLKYGFMNFQNEVVIPFMYEQVHNFSDNGLAAVQKDGLWGYINMSGEVIIPFQYEKADSFDENGLAFVKSNTGKYINANGKTVISGDWDFGSEFDEFGFATVEIMVDGFSESGTINKNGNTIIEYSNDKASYYDGIIRSETSDNVYKIQILNKTNNFDALDDKYIWASGFGDNHWSAVEEKINSTDSRFIYIDQNQNIKLELNKKYTYAGQFKKVQ